MTSPANTYDDQDDMRYDAETKECKANHILFGTTHGTKADAAAVARAMIERYMDVPELCHFYTLKNSDESFHYEIQESGQGIAYLPSLLTMLEGDVPKIIFGTATGRQIAVSMKKDGALKAVNLSGKERVAIKDNPDILPVKRMTPYYDASENTLAWGKAAAAIGFAVLLTGASVNQISTLYAAGYQEIASTLPGHRIAKMLGMQESPKAIQRLLEPPITQWPRAVRMAQMSDSKIDRMYLTEKQTWAFDMSARKSTVKPADSAETPVVLTESGSLSEEPSS